MSGVLLGVRERLYTIHPGDFVDIQPLVSYLFARNNNCTKTMNKARLRFWVRCSASRLAATTITNSFFDQHHCFTTFFSFSFGLYRMFLFQPQKKGVHSEKK